jgi:hypothetical protein
MCFEFITTKMMEGINPLAGRVQTSVNPAQEALLALRM